jgi:hypothetical protein
MKRISEDEAKIILKQSIEVRAPGVTMIELEQDFSRCQFIVRVTWFDGSKFTGWFGNALKITEVEVAEIADFVIKERVKV